MKMKKIICLLLIFLIMVLSISIKSYAATPTLEQIVDTFNNSKSVKQWANSGTGNSLLASSNGDTLTITSVANNETAEVQYLLDGNILSTTINKDDIAGAMASMYLIDSIGQLQGYEDGELLTTLSSGEIVNYTIDNEGYEIKQLDDGKVSIKADITKKIPLIDTGDSYIEVSDLQDLKNFISGNGSAEKSKGNIWFNKSGYDGKNTLLIAEKDNLTDNAYKSILSIIEVMFDSSKASDYFKTNYSGISIGNKEFTGFNVEINPTKTEFEENLIPSDSGYKFIRITINKELANSAIAGNKVNNITNNNDSGTKKQDSSISTQEKLPQAGTNIIIPIVSISLIIVAVILYKKYNDYKDVK